MERPRDTIFALASGAGRAGIAVMRISGVQAASAVSALTGSLPLPRQAKLSQIRLQHHAEPIDTGLVIWFPGPGSFTGEDCAEFHLHGSRAVIAAMMQALGGMDGLRIALPGEFTRRAFANGKLDLAQAEGLAQLIDSETEQQRRQAIRQMSGHFGKLAETLRAELVGALALVEAELDFSEEDDVPSDAMRRAKDCAAKVCDVINQILASAVHAERLSDGLVVAIAGPPNVGKSSLLNQMARRDVAIVSPVAGTTRDLVAVNMDIDGFPVQIIDTAGIRKTASKVESIGIERARAAIRRADLVLWLDDGSKSKPIDRPEPIDIPTWTVRSKIDLKPQDQHKSDFAVSATTGQGVSSLLEAIGGFAARQFSSPAGSIVMTLRHREALGQTVDALMRAHDAVQSIGLEVIAEDLRVAVRRLGSIAGRVDVEEILGTIFAKFCIGK